jgi:hypothetical protein
MIIFSKQMMYEKHQKREQWKQEIGKSDSDSDSDKCLILLVVMV